MYIFIRLYLYMCFYIYVDIYSNIKTILKYINGYIFIYPSLQII